MRVFCRMQSNSIKFHQFSIFQFILLLTNSSTTAGCRSPTFLLHSKRFIAILLPVCPCCSLDRIRPSFWRSTHWSNVRRSSSQSVQPHSTSEMRSFPLRQRLLFVRWIHLYLSFYLKHTPFHCSLCYSELTSTLGGRTNRTLSVLGCYIFQYVHFAFWKPAWVFRKLPIQGQFYVWLQPFDCPDLI